MELISERYIPPPVQEAQHEYTIRMTEHERLSLISVLRAGKGTTAFSTSYEVASKFLDILGVRP